MAVPPVDAATARLARCAERAFRQATCFTRAGNKISAIGASVEREVRRSGFDVVRELGGHGVGRAIHESPQVPNYHAQGADPADGMNPASHRVNPIRQCDMRSAT